jgi:hypothetical protein
VTSVTLLLVMSQTNAPILLLANGRGGALAPARVRRRDRLAARWNARRLDRALAEGTSPEASAALALRAQRLTEPDRRWSLAGALRRIVRDADRNRPVRGIRVVPNRRAVKAAREALSRLADTLDDPGPVSAQGVARAWLLLTDGTGPLYNARDGFLLSVCAAQAVDELRNWSA